MMDIDAIIERLNRNAQAILAGEMVDQNECLNAMVAAAEALSFLKAYAPKR